MSEHQNNKGQINNEQILLKKQQFEGLKAQYEKEMNEYQTSLKNIDTTINQKNQQLNNLRQVLVQKANEQEKQKGLSQQLNLKKNDILNLQSQLGNLKDSIVSTMNKENDRKGQLKNQLSLLQESITNKKTDKKNTFINDKINKKVEQLQHQIGNIQNNKNTHQNYVNELKNKNHQQKSQSNILNEKTQKISNQNKNEKLAQLDSKLKQFSVLIQNKKQQNLKQISEIENAKKQQINSNTEKTVFEINKIKVEINQLKNNQSQIQKIIETTKKQQIQIQKNTKAQQKPIQQQKNKNQTLKEKAKKNSQENSELQNQVSSIMETRKIKVEPKIPEELVQLKIQKQQILNKIKSQTQKYLKSKQLNDNLVPPSLIENIKTRINQILQRKQKYIKLSKQNVAFLQENKKLDVLKEKLEWEDNQQVNTQEATRQKQEIKHKSLEEQLSKVRKDAFQVNSKLEDYQKSYPQFKPEKKMKKIEAALPQSAKKQEAEQKGNKKVKNGKNNVVIEQPKTKIKQQKKISPAPVVVIKELSPKKQKAIVEPAKTNTKKSKKNK